MQRFSICLLLAICVIGLTACGSSPDADDRPGAKIPTEKTVQQSPSETQPHAHTLPDTMALLPIMVHLERDMQSISSGLWRHDFEQIAASADNIANHPKIQPADLKTIQSILGDTQFRTFVRDDRQVHSMALELRDAARNEDFKKVADAYQKLEQGCISCHLSHRTTIRESPEWR